MNIFENYLSEINKIILDNKKILKLRILENLNNANLEVPPEHLNFDLSTNVSLVLAKSNNLNPINLAKHIKDLLSKNINHFENIEIAKPGFLNIKLSKDGFVTNINGILNEKDSYGSKKSNKNYNINLCQQTQQALCMLVIVEEQSLEMFCQIYYYLTEIM